MFSGTEAIILLVLFICLVLPVMLIALVVVLANRRSVLRKQAGVGIDQAALRRPPAPAAQAGWFTDPAGRHEQRYWDGARWTDAVVTDGQPGTDPL